MSERAEAMPGTLEPTPSQSFSTRARAAARAALAWAAENWVFLLVVGAGIALRVLTMVAYEPSLPLRVRDASAYVARSITLSVEGSYHPFLYSVILKPFTLAGSLEGLMVVQHAAGVTVGVLIFLLLRRFGLGPSLAALGAAPALLDGYLIALEHQPLSETFFALLTLSGVIVTAWSGRPRLATTAAAGFLLAVSVLIRYAGVAVLFAVLVYFVIRRVGWTRLVALLAAFLIPLLAYATWFQTQTGVFGITDRNGFYLYGRVVQFADCSDVDVPIRERVFCPENLRRTPGRGLFHSGLPPKILKDPDNNSLASSFAWRMIIAKPGAFAAAVGTDFGRNFLLRGSQDNDRWLVPLKLRANDQLNVPPGIELHFRVRFIPAALIRDWQEGVSVYGPLLAVFLALGVGGTFAGWGRIGRPPLGPESLLFTLAATSLLLFPTLFAVYHFRYTLPAVPFAGAGGVVGASILYSRLRRGVESGRA